MDLEKSSYNDSTVLGPERTDFKDIVSASSIEKKPYFGMTGTQLNIWVTVACTTAMTLFGQCLAISLSNYVLMPWLLSKVMIKEYSVELSSHQISWIWWVTLMPTYRAPLFRCTISGGRFTSSTVAASWFLKQIISSFFGAISTFMFGTRSSLAIVKSLLDII